MDAIDDSKIRQLFDDYVQMYSSRDDRLTTYFSENFSGFTGGGDFLVKNQKEWIEITRQDFDQIKEPIRIELKDLAIQSLADTIAVATGFFTIHLPIKDHVLSNETARLVLIFRLESEGWKISHSSISIPYHLVREGEVYPMNELVDRNQFLEKLVAERTTQLSDANEILKQTNEKLACEIVEHKQTEEDLQKSLSLLSASLESTADGILIVDGQGKIVRWNRKFSEMWKIPQHVLSAHNDEDTMNHILSQLVEPGQFADKVRTLYEQPEQSSFDQIKFLDGRIFERYSQPQRIENAIVGRVWSFRDITERKKLESQVFQAQKMESIGKLAGGIAHNFNNILASILGFSDLALDEVEKGSSIEDDLHEIYAGGLRAKEIVKQILAFARQSDENVKPTRVDTIIIEALKLICPVTPTTIEIRQDIVSSSRVMCNSTQIHQIMMNLCTNAAHAMQDAGGIMEISLKDIFLREDNGNIPGGLKKGKYIELIISDTGYGIALEHIDSIFDPYFTTKDTGEGTGMGLATVRGSIDSYEGTITVESTPYIKTIFTIYLPVTSSMDNNIASAADEPLRGDESILFVDDEPTIARMGKRILENLGYTVTSRTSSLEALELFRANPDRFTLVITDMTMPHMTGDKFAMALKKIREDVRIILCTGYSNKISAENAKEIGIDAFTYKPFSKSELAHTVRDVLTKA